MEVQLEIVFRLKTYLSQSHGVVLVTLRYAEGAHVW